MSSSLLDKADESKGEHGYDINIVYHSHASNIPHINTWIDELVTLTEKGLPARKFPSTQDLVDCLQRYDAVYRELLRQTSIFSEPVTKQLAKVWAGTLKLLDYMVKSYHRYVKHTSTIQEQAEILLDEKNHAMIASKVKEDEFELERTYLKAKIRNLEAEIDSMNATQREMGRENLRLRGILSRYVQSDGLNVPVWDLMNKDSDINPEVAMHNPYATEKESGDPSRHRLREINRLDIEMNEVLANALKEQDRQEIIMKDIVSLLENNQEIFGPGSVADKKWLAGTVIEKTFTDCAVQVDEKEEFGVVTELLPRNDEEIEANPPSNVTVPKVKGAEIPWQLRRKFQTYPQVLRIPPAAWLCQSIMAIYIDKIYADREREEKGLLKETLAEHVHTYYMRLLQLNALADGQSAQLIKACDHYEPTLRRVALFASQIGLHDKEAPPNMDTTDTSFILRVIEELMKLGELVPEKASRRKLTDHGVVFKADVLRSACLKVIHNIFEDWLPDGGHDYAVKVKTMEHTDKGSKYVDMDEFIEILIEPWQTVRLDWEEHVAFLFHEHCNIQRILGEAQFANDNGVNDRDSILSQLSKQGTVCPLCSHSSMTDCDDDDKTLLTELLVAFYLITIITTIIIITTTIIITITIITTIIIIIITTTTITIITTTTTITTTIIITTGAKESQRRPMRLFQQLKTKQKDDTGTRKGPEAVQREPVVETMNRKSFTTTLLIINPSLSVDYVEDLFEEALEYAHQVVLRDLELMWMHVRTSTTEVDNDNDDSGFELGRSLDSYSRSLMSPMEEQTKEKKPPVFYVNTRTQLAQWRKPYEPHTFRAKDIEYDTFLHIIISKNVLASSPLSDLLHMTPKDLWPNADMFLKQIAKGLIGNKK